jgi:hypothetical protein
MAIKRFKLDDGREGFMGTMDNGMVELVFDDGTNVILARTTPSEGDHDQVQPLAEGSQYPSQPGSGR